METTSFSPIDIKYMRRALALARNGLGFVSPNPMVGAVIVAPDGKIIGEGFHQRFGSAHAEVNAFASVKAENEHLLSSSTIYVTLEPCSHFGKTPPCAQLLIDRHIGRVVVGSEDPNPKVAGRGIKMLSDAGIDVISGILSDECKRLNATFFTSQLYRRPFITLKWAQSTDGFIDSNRPDGKPEKFSSLQTQQIVHIRRAHHDAIAVGARTVLADSPRLDVRLFKGQSPTPILFDRHKLVDLKNWQIKRDAIVVDADIPLDQLLKYLFEQHNISSLLVEGGASLIQEFIDNGLWDNAIIETSPRRLGLRGTVHAPIIDCAPRESIHIGDNLLSFYSQNSLAPSAIMP